MAEKIIGEVYFHISNGGVTFQIIDEGFGATIQIDIAHMGHTTNKIKLHTNQDGIKKLAELLRKAKKIKYSKDYSNVATIKKVT